MSGLSFLKDGKPTTNLSEINSITFENSNLGKFTLDITGGKIEYQPTSGSKVEITNFVDIVKKIFGAKENSGDITTIAETKLGTTFAKVADITADALITKLTTGSTKLIKETDLQTKLAEKANVDAITGSTDFTSKVYTKTAADTAFAKSAALVNYLQTSELPTKLAEKANVDAITGSTDFTSKVYTKTNADNEFAKKGEVVAQDLTGYLKTTDLPTEVAKTANVDAIIASTDFTSKVYTKTNADNAFAKKGEVVAPDLTGYLETSQLPTKLAEKANVDAITGSTDFTSKVYTKTNADNEFAKKGEVVAQDLNGYLKTTDLPTEVAKTANVDAIIASTDFTSKVYTKIAADTEFAKKANTSDLSKYLQTSELPTKLAEKANVEAIFDATDLDKNIAETKLGTTFAKAADLGSSRSSTSSPTATEVATKLIEQNKDKLGSAVLDATTNDGNKFYSMVLESKDTAGKDLKQQILEARINPLSEQVVGNKGFKDYVKDKLAENDKFKAAVKDKLGKDFITNEIKKPEVVKEIFNAKNLGGQTIVEAELKKIFATKDDIKPDTLVPVLKAGTGDSGVYSKTQTDTALNSKADKTDITAAKLVPVLKAGTGDFGVYSKADTDTALNSKANAAEVYSKIQIDAFAKSKALPIDTSVLNPTNDNDIPDSWANLI